MNEYNRENYNNFVPHQNHTTKRRIIVCATILLIGFAIAGLLYTIKPKPKKRPSGSLVLTLKAIPIKLGDVKLHISGYGTVYPDDEILLSAQSKGIIISKHPDMEIGLVVQKGELLAQIDSADAKLALQTASAEIERLQNELQINEQSIKDTKQEIDFENKVLAIEKSNYARKKDLFDKKITSRSTLETAEKSVAMQMRKFIILKGKLQRLNLSGAAIKSQQAKAKIAQSQAKLNIERCTILSPICGRLKKAFVTNGDYVQPGQKILSIADDSKLKITVELSAYDIIKAMGLKKANIKLYKNWFSKPNSKIPVEITWMEAEHACSWVGKLTHIRNFDKTTRTLSVTVVPLRPTDETANRVPLVDGMFCKVTFTGRTLKNAMEIPWAAIQLDGDAFTIDKTGILHKRKISIYSVHDDKVLIDGGLPVGEMLVVQRLPRGLFNGSKVNIARIDQTDKPKLSTASN
jgi:multidrug efflux pump subunit AcrA (membrane-fusion protein)